MPNRTKKLLILLLASIVILVLSWVFRPFEPDEQEFNQEQEQEEIIDQEFPM